MSDLVGVVVVGKAVDEAGAGGWVEVPASVAVVALGEPVDVHPPAAIRRRAEIHLDRCQTMS